MRALLNTAHGQLVTRTKRYAYYRCPKSSCRAINVRKAEIESKFVRYLEALAPKPEYLRMFRAIVLDVWKEKQSEIEATRRTLQTRLENLEAKKDRVVSAFLHERLIDQPTYQRQVQQLDEDIALAEMAANDAKLDQLDIEGVLGFAEHVLNCSLDCRTVTGDYATREEQHCAVKAPPSPVNRGERTKHRARRKEPCGMFLCHIHIRHQRCNEMFLERLGRLLLTGTVRPVLRTGRTVLFVSLAQKATTTFWLNVQVSRWKLTVWLDFLPLTVALTVT